MTKNAHQRPIAALLTTVLAATALAILAVGCGKKEEEVPKGTTYYTGPMKPKGAGNSGN